MNTAEEKIPESAGFHNISVYLGCKVIVAVTEKEKKKPQ